MHILIAPNAFKNSLPAMAAATAIQKGLAQSRLRFTSECFPIADGGDGTAQLITQLCKGVFFDTGVHDPLGKTIRASAGLIHDGQTAVIDLATASGLKLLTPESLRPRNASTYGTGELITAVLDKKVKRIIIGVGGSATVDGGCGLAEALGVKFLDADRRPMAAIPENLARLVQIDLSGTDPRMLNCECTVLCDVTSPLLGRTGAAHVFGPQKGASETDVNFLEMVLSHVNTVALKATGITMSTLPHGGAAGGAAAGLHAFFHAQLVTGIDHYLDITGFDAALDRADLLITGEGSIDEQTLSGKAPYGVAVRAKHKKIPVVVLAGKVPLESSPSLSQWFDVMIPIGDGPAEGTMALKNTTPNLIRTAEQIGNLLHASGIGKNR